MQHFCAYGRRCIAEMAGIGFSSRLTLKLRTLENDRATTEAKKPGAVTSRQMLDQFIDFMRSPMASGYREASRKLKMGLSCLTIAAISAALQHYTGLSFFIWYIPLCVAWISMVFRRRLSRRDIRAHNR